MGCPKYTGTAARDVSALDWPPTCTDPTDSCSLCCAVFTDPDLRAAFGYQEDTAVCECHDICVEDVRLICVHEETVSLQLPGVDALAANCRGRRIVTNAAAFTCLDVTVTCAEENLLPDCSGVENEVGLQVVLESTTTTPPMIFLINTTVTFECTQFFTFPDGQLRNSGSTPSIQEELTLIDGSCKTIIIKSCEVIPDPTCPRVEVGLKVIDKLWKFENLLVSAIRPYPENITVSTVFGGNQLICPCPPSPCP